LLIKLSRLKLEVSLLVLSFSWVLFSYFYSFGQEPDTFFARSGAVMVLLAVIVEFRLNNELFKVMQNNFYANYSKVKPVPSLPPRHKIISRLAHLFVVVGTFIWGYGDIIF